MNFNSDSRTVRCNSTCYPPFWRITMNELIVGCVGGVATIASACVTYFKPKHAAKIVAAIGIVATAAVEVTNLFF